MASAEWEEFCKNIAHMYEQRVVNDIDETLTRVSFLSENEYDRWARCAEHLYEALLIAKGQA